MKTITCIENTQIDLARSDATLSSDPDSMHVAVVHCQTTTGIINPIEEYGNIARRTPADRTPPARR